MIMDLLGRVVMMGDVDHFKSINDTYGHPVGDEVLQEIARRLLQCVCSYDFVGRYGGEEFLLVLNNCKPQFAQGRAEEIRLAVGSQPILTAGGRVPATMSFGLLLSDSWGVRPTEELLQEVDAAL
jgi:two-component system, cell cycle response regulator